MDAERLVFLRVADESAQVEAELVLYRQGDKESRDVFEGWVGIRTDFVQGSVRARNTIL